jgi:hypothetical protein
MKATLLRSSKGGEVVKKYVEAATSQNFISVGEDWEIKKSNSNRITKVFDNQRNAITQAIKIAINQKSEVTIREKDDFPPRG